MILIKLNKQNKQNPNAKDTQVIKKQTKNMFQISFDVINAFFSIIKIQNNLLYNLLKSSIIHKYKQTKKLID